MPTPYGTSPSHSQLAYVISVVSLMQQYFEPLLQHLNYSPYCRIVLNILQHVRSYMCRNYVLLKFPGGSGHCYGMGLILGPQTYTRHGCGQKEVNFSNCVLLIYDSSRGPGTQQGSSLTLVNETTLSITPVQTHMACMSFPLLKTKYKDKLIFLASESA